MVYAGIWVRGYDNNPEPNEEASMRMWSKWSLLLIVVSAPAQAGDINIGTTLASGDVMKAAAGQELSHKDLSRGQLQALTLWFGLHRSGWHGMSTTASNEVSSLQFNLKDTEGKAATIDVVAQADGGYHLRFISADKWSYRSFRGLVKYKAAAQPLSDEELLILKKILGVT